MMLFLVDQFAREFQRRTDVLDGQVVLALNILEADFAGQLPTTIATGVRVPRITGLPWQIFGSMTIRSIIVLAMIGLGSVAGK